VVPQQLGTGKEQPVFLRFLQANASAHRALYFDSFAYIPSWCRSDTLAGCDGERAPVGSFLLCLLLTGICLCAACFCHGCERFRHRRRGILPCDARHALCVGGYLEE
jgi:hypothetical protein